MKVRIRPEAWLDIEEAIRYLNEEDGAETAVRFYRRVRQTFKELSRQPGLGRPRRDLKPPGVRSWRVANPFQNWLVFYQITEPGLEILRVKHGAMDLPALFKS